MTPVNERVLRAARRVFAANGYKATSMLAVAEQAGIAVGGLYKYYPSKLELFQAVYTEENKSSKERIASRIDWSYPRSAIGDYLQASIRAIKRNKILAEWYSDVPGEMIRQVYAEDLKKSSKQGCDMLGDFFAERIVSWRNSGQLRQGVTDRLIGELFVAVFLMNESPDITPRTTQFAIDALLDAIIIDK